MLLDWLDISCLFKQNLLKNRNMKYKELKNKPKAELDKLVKESREKLRELRFKIANRSLKNITEVDKTKKIIAKALTALKQTK
ncbi:MAG: 50S ribosomal protein L29 [Parcubacteria group bacterium CG10_big_fil_rev_8_21_14_0_10_36_14]|nr:MAG: 50S ribosomal protein L29 [Parcubacteria group bacterium CG10_big_fil_rev_8_21_14_0_10_36_14]